MRDWKVKLVRLYKRYAELDVEAHTEQEAIEVAEAAVNDDHEGHWSDHSLEEQYVDEIAEL